MDDILDDFCKFYSEKCSLGRGRLRSLKEKLGAAGRRPGSEGYQGVGKEDG
jgi:hypothetical protein